MEMSGSRDVPASVEATWNALNDPEVLKACIAGCESIDKVSDNEYQVAMTARVGPVSAKFSGRIMLSDIVAPKSYTIKFEGQGGAAGFASGEAQVELSPAGSGTRIDYKAKAQVGGKLAQIGSRLVDGAAAKVADDFFGRLVERLGGSKEVAECTADAADDTARGGGVGVEEHVADGLPLPPRSSSRWPSIGLRDPPERQQGSDSWTALIWKSCAKARNGTKKASGCCWLRSCGRGVLRRARPVPCSRYAKTGRWSARYRAAASRTTSSSVRGARARTSRGRSR